MPHFDRGVYEPSDDMRVFDGAEEDEDVEGSRLPLLIVLALLVLAMFAGVVWLAYTQGVARGRTETPVLTAENGPARIAPQNPGGVEQPYKGFKIYEQPAPPDDAVDSTNSTPSTAAAPPPPKPAPAAAVPAPKPVAPPAAPAPKPAAPAPAPKIAAATPVPAAAKPSPVASSPAAAATGAPRSLALVPAKPAAAPAAPAAAPAVTVPVPSAGAYVLQIGAYKSQAEADVAWKAYKAKHAALLANANDDIQQADLGDKGTWYRLRITGFPSKDVASAMCDRLKADGGGCFLGK
jgi:cell division protein FtsN